MEDDDDDLFVYEPRKRRRAAQASTSSRGKRRKEEEEAREARYVSQPSSQVQDRICRAFQHRMFLIEKRRESDVSCDFIVLGSTANVYTVKLSKHPSCNCPDFGRCHTCKHILFVMLRVLKLRRDDPRIWQKALLASEVKEMLECLDGGQVESTILASQRVRQQFQRLEGKEVEGGDIADEDVQKPIQRPVEGDCPVCYEGMEADGEAVVFCNTCGNNVHKECFERWSKSKAASSGKVTCIYCRAVWKDEKKAAAAAGSSGGGYVNLASVSEDHDDVSLESLYPEVPSYVRRFFRS